MKSGTKKIKLTQLVSVNMPLIPNFIIHEDGNLKETVPLNLFSKKQLSKIAKEWSKEFVSRGVK